MITPRLWRALHHPFSTVMYRRFVTAKPHRHLPQQVTDILHRFWTSDLVPLSVLFGLLLLGITGGMDLVVAVLSLLPLSFLASGTITGMLLTSSVSNTIASERERGHYELVSVTPVGSVGASWEICHQTYRDNRLLQSLKGILFGIHLLAFFVGVLFLIFAVGLWAALVSTNSRQYDPTEYASIWHMIIFYFSILVAVRIDAMQSIVVGGLVGMISPTYTSNQLDARGIAVGVYLLIQFFYYSAAAVVCFRVIPWAYDVTGVTKGVEATVIQVVVFFLMREAVIYVLWHILAYRLNANRRELSHTAGFML